MFFTNGEKDLAEEFSYYQQVLAEQSDLFVVGIY